MTPLLTKHRNNLIDKFTSWRQPPLLLPPQSVIDEVLAEAIREAKAEGRNDGLEEATHEVYSQLNAGGTNATHAAFARACVDRIRSRKDSLVEAVST